MNKNTRNKELKAAAAALLADIRKTVKIMNPIDILYAALMHCSNVSAGMRIRSAIRYLKGASK